MKFTEVTVKHHGYSLGYKYFYQYPRDVGWGHPVNQIRDHMKATYGTGVVWVPAETGDWGHNQFNEYWYDDRKRHRIYFKNEKDITMLLLKFQFK
jgi:hypothetical protein